MPSAVPSIPNTQTAALTIGDWLVVIGAAGGLGNLAVQYGQANGAQVIGVDEYVDFRASPNIVEDIRKITNGGAHAVVVTAGNPEAFSQAAEMLRVGGTLSCVGIPPRKSSIETPASSIVIKGLRITGNLVGSLKECLETVELVRRVVVKPKVSVRPFRDLPSVYEGIERNEITGRIVLKIGYQ